MPERVCTAEQLQKDLFAVLDRVAEGRESVLVTRNGRAVARLVGVDQGRGDLEGTATIAVSDAELVRPIDVAWDAESD